MSPVVWLVAILTLVVAMRLPFIFGGLIDWDEGVYWQSLRAMSSGHALYGDVYSAQPPAFLLTLFPGYALLGHSLVAARMVMLAWMVVAILAAYGAGRAMAGTRAGLVAAVLLGLDPLVLRQSVTVQAEAPALALALVAVACAAATPHSATRRRADLLALLAGAALALGVLCKLLDVAAVVPVAVLLTQRSATGDVARRCLIAAAGGLLIAAALLLPFVGHWRSLVDQSIGLHLASQGLDEGGWSADMVQATAREIPLVLIALVGVAALRRQAPRAALTLGSWLLATALSLALVHPLWPHHLSAAAAPLAIAGGAGLSALIAARHRLLGGTAALVGIGGVLGAVGVQAHLLRAPVMQSAPDAVVAALAAATRSGDVVVSDDQYAVASADRDVPAPLVDTSLVRINSGSLTTQAAEDAALGSDARAVFFSTGRLRHLDGFTDWVVANFPEKRDFGDGVVLYVRPRG